MRLTRRAKQVQNGIIATIAGAGTTPDHGRLDLARVNP
jgi:hypothetical protein